MQFPKLSGTVRVLTNPHLFVNEAREFEWFLGVLDRLDGQVRIMGMDVDTILAMKEVVCQNEWQTTQYSWGKALGYDVMVENGTASKAEGTEGDLTAAEKAAAEDFFAKHDLAAICDQLHHGSQ
jgi:hypothetical protein